MKAVRYARRYRYLERPAASFDTRRGLWKTELRENMMKKF